MNINNAIDCDLRVLRLDRNVALISAVYKWCTLRPAPENAAKPQIENIALQSEQYSELNLYMVSKVQMWLQRAATGSHDDLILVPFRISSLAIQLVENISKFPNTQDCWKYGSEFYLSLKKATERCGAIIKQKSDSAEDIDKQCLSTYQEFFRSLVSISNSCNVYQDLLENLLSTIPDLETALLLSGDLANIKINKQAAAGIYQDDLGNMSKLSQRPLNV